MSRVSGIFPFLWRPPGFTESLLRFALSELELEVPGLYEGADKVVALVRAQGIDQEEHLLDVLNRVCQVVHRDARYGVAGALAFVQFRSGYELHIVSGLSGDAACGALEDMEDDFGVCKAIVDLLPLENVINGSP